MRFADSRELVRPASIETDGETASRSSRSLSPTCERPRAKRLWGLSEELIGVSSPLTPAAA